MEGKMDVKKMQEFQQSHFHLSKIHVLTTFCGCRKLTFKKKSKCLVI